MKLLNAMATIASFTMVSRITGMVRDMLTASFLGAGPVADAFFVALKLPNFFRRVAAEGAFSVSFVPLYTRTIEQEGEEAGGRFAGEVLTVMAVILALFSAVMMAGMPWIIHVIAPGFEEGTLRYDLAVILTQITFPYLMLMSFSSLFGGMLNSHNKFGPFAAAPIIFNLTIIAAMFTLGFVMPTMGHSMSVGITLSGVLQLGMMVYFIRKYKINFRFSPFVIGAKTKQLFKLMAPGVLSAGLYQVNLFVDMIVASLLPEGSISYLYYADRLNQLPLSLAGIAIGTALLPMLSKSLAAGDKDESRDLFNRSLEFCFFLAVPATVALLIVPLPMVATLFEHGKFTAEDTATTAYVLMGYGIGLPAYIASKVFMTAFWAREDTMTPVRISVLTALTNILLCLLLIGWMGVAGVSVATGLVGWMQVYLLNKKLKGHESMQFDERLKTVFPKIVVCSCIMAVVLSVLGYGLYDFFHGDLWVKIPALVALLGAGAITYAVAIHVSGVLKISDIKHYLKRSKG
ncbi:MAG: murein biosynthesis integral membrane protein MurJ [Pseudobdellovibrionaceae bacterium]